MQTDKTGVNDADPAENQALSYFEGNEVNPWPYLCSIIQCKLCLPRAGVGNPQLASRMRLFHPSAVAPCSVGVQYAGEVSPRLLIQPKLLPCTFSRSSVLK